MGTILIDKLLSASVNERASDLEIRVHYPPRVRVDGRIQDLENLPLTPSDIDDVVDCITPERCRKELQDAGQTSFDFGFGWAARVHALITERSGTSSIKFHLS